MSKAEFELYLRQHEKIRTDLLQLIYRVKSLTVNKELVQICLYSTIENG
jgi:hypothetical protein